MIKFLEVLRHLFGTLFTGVMTLTAIIIFSCVALIGLACFDYLCDSDMKGALVKELGPRPLLKNLRQKVVDFFDKHDDDVTKEDVMVASDEDYRKRYLYGGRIPPEDIAKIEDYDAKIHEEIEKIFKSVEDGNNG